MDYLVKESLRSLLLRKIYKADIGLVRNDSRSAKLVYDFVRKVSEQAFSEQDTDGPKLKNAEEIYYSIEPLVGLTEGTIRKYISKLWRDSYSLALFLEVQAPYGEAFDSRRYY